MKYQIIAIAMMALPVVASAQNPQRGDHYLYCHMAGDGEYTAYATSPDGVVFHDLIEGKPVFDPKEHARIEGGTRDAYITRSHDGQKYLMVTTDMCVAKSGQWFNYGIDLLKSDDLINWQSKTFDFREGPKIFSDADATPTYQDYSTIRRVWAPQIFWNPDYQWQDGRKGGYMIYMSLLNDINGEDPYDRMYYCYADENFDNLTQPKLMFDWGYATIDADINYLESDGLYHMMIKKEGGKPGLFTSASPKLEGPYPQPVEDDYVSFEGNKKCEGVSAFQLDGAKDWRIAYIEYSSNPKHYRICKADEYMRNFSDPKDIIGVASPQHGSFMRITKDEYDRLEAWSDSVNRAARTFDIAVDPKASAGVYSVQIPDGNYVVTLSLGDKKLAGNTSVKAESRRLMLQDVKTKKGEKRDVSFVVNKRNTDIGGGEKVGIKPREKTKLNWDDELTIEICGENPVCSNIHIEPAGDDVTTLFLCGNSTVVDQDNEPWASWGQILPYWFDDKVAVANYAESGETATTFISAKRLKKLLTFVKPGDYIFVEFGHNDQKQKNPGAGAYYNFATALKTFVDEARSRGANPVFVTPTQRRSFDNHGHIQQTHGDYPDAMRWVAQRENVPVIELQNATRTFYEALGDEKSKRAFVHYPAGTYPGQTEALADNTHFNPYGAYEISKMIVEGCKALNLPFISHLRPGFEPYDPAQPDDPDTFIWYESPYFDPIKPDGN